MPALPANALSPRVLKALQKAFRQPKPRLIEVERMVRIAPAISKLTTSDLRSRLMELAATYSVPPPFVTRWALAVPRVVLLAPTFRNDLIGDKARVLGCDPRDLVLLLGLKLGPALIEPMAVFEQRLQVIATMMDLPRSGAVALVRRSPPLLKLSPQRLGRLPGIAAALGVPVQSFWPVMRSCIQVLKLTPQRIAQRIHEIALVLNVPEQEVLAAATTAPQLLLMAPSSLAAKAPLLVQIAAACGISDGMSGVLREHPKGCYYGREHLMQRLAIAQSAQTTMSFPALLMLSDKRVKDLLTSARDQAGANSR